MPARIQILLAFALLASSNSFASIRPPEKINCAKVVDILKVVIDLHPEQIQTDIKMTRTALSDLPSQLDTLGLAFDANDVDTLFKNPTEDIVNTAHMAFGRLELFPLMHQRLDRAYGRLKLLLGEIEESETLKTEIVNRSKVPGLLLRAMETLPVQDAAEWESRWKDQLAFHFMARRKDGFSEDDAFILAIRSYRRNVLKALEPWKNGANYFMLNSYMRMTSPHTSMTLKYNNAPSPLGRVGLQFREVVLGFEIKDSTAKGDLKKGDIITHFRNEGSDKWISLRGKSVEEAVEKLQGEPNTKVNFKIIRDGKKMKTQATRFEVPIEKESVVQSAVVTNDQSKLGIIRLSTFGEFGLALEVGKHIIDFNELDVEGLVMDLRGNGGGYVNEAIKLLGHFIGGRIAGYMETSQGKESLAAKKQKAIWTKPLVILVDQESASASEMFALYAKDLGRAVVVGGPLTHGKGTRFIGGEKKLSKSEKLEFHLTDGHFYSALGSSPQLTGVFPHIAFPIPGPISTQREVDLRGVLPRKPYSGKISKSKPFLSPDIMNAQVAELSARMIDRIQKSPEWRPGEKTESDLWLQESLNILQDLVKLQK